MSLRPRDDRPTAAALAYMGEVRQMRCICCALLGLKQTSPTNFHHIRANGQARNDFLGLPLCYECHQGPRGVHGDEGYLRQLKMTEWDLAARVNELIFLRRAIEDDHPF